MDFGPMAKFFLFVFTILLSLSMGLFVGQNYLLDNETAIENSDVSPSESSATNQVIFSLKTQFKKLLDKFVANDEASDPRPEALEDDKVTNKIIIKPQEKISVDTKVQTKSTIEDNRSLEADSNPTKDSVKKVAKKPSRLEEIDEEGAKAGWVIQVAAFQERTDADKVELQITRAGFPSYIYKTKINGQTWYRINVGPFTSVTEATNFKQSQKVHTKFKGAFVRKL